MFYDRSQEVEKVVGTIEATGPATISTQGGVTRTVYTTIRFRAQDGRQIIKEGVTVGGRVDSFLSPGRVGTFYLWQRNKIFNRVLWLFAFRSPENGLFQDLDGENKGIFVLRLIAYVCLGLPAYWYLSSSNSMSLFFASPMILLGLICWWGYRAAASNNKVMRAALPREEASVESETKIASGHPKKKQGFWLSGPAD